MTTFGPQQGPPKLLCVFCRYGFPHEHHDGYPPLLPCQSCFVGLHDRCDPLTWFCCCLDTNCAQGAT